MRLNLKNFLILLLPIITIGSFSAFYRYKYVLNPDGLKDSKGNYYDMNIGWYIDTEAFVNRCLTFEQNGSKIYYGEKKARPIRGEASQDETKRLEEEGVPFSRLPWAREDA